MQHTGWLPADQNMSHQRWLRRLWLHVEAPKSVVQIQWNLGNRDTQGAVKTVLNSEVVLFLRSISM